MALRINVSTLEDVMTAKLMAITEQEPDFSAVLEWARALREQIDWDDVRARTEASPFAKAFFTLVEGSASSSADRGGRLPQPAVPNFSRPSSGRSLGDAFDVEDTCASLGATRKCVRTVHATIVLGGDSSICSTQVSSAHSQIHSPRAAPC